MIGVRNWLSGDNSISQDQQYQHRTLKEVQSRSLRVLSELDEYYRNAHEDARLEFLGMTEDSLDPLEESNETEFLPNYPGCLDMNTLKGWFGEVFAGLVAENFDPLGVTNWKVPAFLFRFHKTVFDQLERIRQTNENFKRVPGRTGDDCLAFQLSADKQILRSLVCEAKCTAKHDSDMIAKAHDKISKETHPIPIDILRVIQILRSRKGDPEAIMWANALQKLRNGNFVNGYERCDLVCYVCGQFPIDKATWLTVEGPHHKYTVSRRLAAVEVHLNNVENLIRTIYGKGD